MLIRAFEPADAASVVALWQAAGLTRPWNDPRKDIDRKLRQQPELFLVGHDGGTLVASVMAGYEGHRGWLNYLAVDPAHRGRGHARQLLAQVEAMLAERGCPKVNLQVRTSNAEAIAFYRRIGYLPDDVVCYGKRLIVDDEGPG